MRTKIILIAVSLVLAGFVGRNPATGCNQTTVTKSFHKAIYDRIPESEFQAEWIPLPKRRPMRVVGR